MWGHACAKVAPIMSTLWTPQDLIAQMEAVGPTRFQDPEHPTTRRAARSKAVAGVGYDAAALIVISRGSVKASVASECRLTSTTRCVSGSVIRVPSPLSAIVLTTPYCHIQVNPCCASRRQCRHRYPHGGGSSSNGVSGASNRNRYGHSHPCPTRSGLDADGSSTS